MQGDVLVGSGLYDVPGRLGLDCSSLGSATRGRFLKDMHVPLFLSQACYCPLVLGRRLPPEFSATITTEKIKCSYIE